MNIVPLLILAPVVLVLVAFSLPGWRKDHRPAVIVPEPERIATVTARVVTDLPDREERSAFAYDNGLAIERPEQDED